MTGSGKTEIYLRAAADGARAGARGDRARARDRADAADRRALHRTLRRHRRRAALAAAPGRALRRVAAAARGRGAGLRRSALGRVRADRRPRPDRRRRGARRLLQARGRPALRRPRGRRRARAPRAARCCCWAAPRRGRRACTGCPRSRLPSRVDGRPLPPRRGARHARRGPRACIPHTAQALAEVRAARGKAIVLLNRRGWSNFLSCRSCGRVWSCPQCDVALVLHRAGGYLACHHCGHREPAPARCGDCRSISVARHGAGTERLGTIWRRLDDGGSVFRLDAERFPGLRACDADADRPRDGRGEARGALLRRFEAAECGGADRHPDGRQGPRLPRRDARRRARRRRDAALPRLPRRGAHVRADRAARRARRARRARGACSCRRSRREARAIAHAAAPRQRRLPRRRARAPRRRSATRRSRT